MPAQVFVPLAAVLVLAALVAACGAGGGAAPAGSPVPQIRLGAAAQFEEVQYVAFEQVTFERLPKARVEPAGEARIEELARRVPAFRLRDSAKAAIRYTADGPRGWWAWQPLAVLYARRELARRENVATGQIQTVDVTEETWTDQCLGAGRPGDLCAQALVPGYRVTLRATGRLYEYHTDQNERAVSAPP